MAHHCGIARILIVDDNPEYAELFTHILVRAGHRVETVTSASAGLLKARSDGFDLVLLDNDLGGAKIPGTTAISAFKNQCRVKVAMLTASLDPTVKGQAAVAGVDAFLRKPVEAEALLATVKKLVG